MTTTTSTINLEVRQFIVNNFLFGEAGQLKDNDSFLDAGIVDSTGILELVAFLEERYAFRVADTELVPDNLDSIDRISRFVTKKLSG
jgi:acyl carrier protein